MSGKAAIISLAMAAMLALAASASASAWHRVTSLDSSINEVTALRSGKLHVVWRSVQSSGESLYDTTISSAGKILGTKTIVSNWVSLSNPALVHTPGSGLNALWGGMHTLNVSDPNQSMNSSVSLDGGKTWTLTKANVVNSANDASGSPVAAANELGTAQTPIMTWNSSSGVWVHAGLSSSSPNYNFQTFGDFGYYPNIAVNGAGQIKLAWYSNATGHLGLWTRDVNPDGSRGSNLMRLPGTSNMSASQAERTGIVARPNGRFYIGYPTGYPSATKVVVWRVGATKPMTVAHLNHKDAVASIASDSSGRLWVVYSIYVNHLPRVFARRSNKSATKWGALVKVGAPKHAGAIYSVDGNASYQALDVFANTQIGSASRSATWTRHVYPGLSLRASRRALIKNRRTKVTFRVTDAGSAVKGAKVHFGGKTKKTNKHGKATFKVKTGHGLKATAKHAHYTKAVLKLKAKKG